MPTNESQINALMDRVARLERQNRRMKVATMAVVVAALGMLALSQPRQGQASEAKEKVIEANKFVLLDSNGKTRATLACDGYDDAAQLTLLDVNETRRITLDAGNKVPVIMLWKPGGKTASTYLALGQIMLHDNDHKASMNLTCDQIMFRDKDDALRFSKP